jgi:dipeptidyl aminopeptidase/acylaminoacyl peptidase
VSPDCSRIVYIPYKEETRDATIKQIDLVDGSVSALTGQGDRASEYGVRWLDADHLLFRVSEFGVKSNQTPAPYPIRQSFFPVVLELSTGVFSNAEGYNLWQSDDGHYRLTCFECAQGYPYECGCAYRLHDLETGEQRHIAQNVAWGIFRGWSANNTWLLFSSSRNRSSGNTELVLAQTETGADTKIAPDGKTVLSASWSPGRETIAYVMCDQEVLRRPVARLENCELWLADQDGGDTRLVLQDQRGRNVLFGGWSPDGQAIVFARCDAQESVFSITKNCELGLVSRDGSVSSTLLSQLPVQVARIGWSLDQSRLVLIESTAYAYAITVVWSLGIDGTDLRPVAVEAWKASVLCEP